MKLREENTCILLDEIGNDKLDLVVVVSCSPMLLTGQFSAWKAFLEAPGNHRAR